MTTTTKRPLISAMQVTLDGYVKDREGAFGWVDSWADGLDLLPPVDAFLLGGGMFPRYELLWGTILTDPDTVAGWLGRDLHAREVAYAKLAAETPHFVLSTTLTETTFPSARIVRDLGEIAALREQPGNAVYVVGGPGLVNTLLHVGLLDELHLIVHPVAVGGGTPLFAAVERHQQFNLTASAPMTVGRVHLTYGTTPPPPPAQPGQRTQREGRGLPRPEDRHGGGADQPGQRDSPSPGRIRTLTGARSVARRHPGTRSTPDGPPLSLAGA